MFEKEIEERLDALEKRVEELSAEVEANKKKQEEEVTLIPGAEYDWVPSYEPKVIGHFTMHFREVRQADSRLGLTDEEWEQFAREDDAP